MYRSPSQEESEFENFMTSFALLLSNLQSEQPFSIVITGDFNCRSNQWWVNDIENDEGKVFEPFISELGLHQLISEPTHLMGSSSSCIDLILTDQPNLFIKTGVHQSLHEQCHHQIVYGKLSVFNIAPRPYSRRIWFYNKANTTAIKKAYHLFEWEKHLNDIACPNEQVKFLNKTLFTIYSNFIPNRLKTMRPREAPWMTQAIKKFLRKTNRAYKNFIKNGMPDDKSAGMQQMVEIGRRMIEEAKRNYFLKVGRTLANPETSKKTYWSLLNNVLHKARIPIIPPLLENNSFITDFTEKAQVFNDYLMLQCSTIDTGSIIPNHASVVSTVLEDVVISEDKILKIIRSLNPNKARGWDEISVRMIRLSDDALVIPLRIIFINCLNQGVFPEIWKYANVVPVYKKNERNVKENYRPISLLPVISKIFEKLIYDSLYPYLASNMPINPNQSGFRHSDSTINQLISITHTIFQAFDCNPPLDVRSMYLDISKAFDRVWHDGLIYKLIRCGVSGKLLALITSFLSDRKQRTVLNGQCSAWGDVTTGVPQGSILGPLLFLVYINDLTVDLRCDVKLFADDTSLFTIVENASDAAIDLNHDLDLIQQWALQWRMSFNPDLQKQAVEMLFSRRHIAIDHPEIRFNNIPVMKVSEHKHLGVILDSKLSFSAHITAAISKARRGIGGLRLLSRYLPRSSLCEIYKLHIRPHLDYGDVLYHIPTKVYEFRSTNTLPSIKEKIESVSIFSCSRCYGCMEGDIEGQIIRRAWLGVTQF